jgi:prepilin-type N-terminal cleavage/methylation domain-containing protein
MTIFQPPSLSRTSLSSEHGFTLIEMLVTLVTGIVVLLATYFVLDVSIRESSRLSERVDADQRGRIAMEKILQELHSSCVASGVTPVESGSTSTKLEIISQTGNETVFPHVTKHVIQYVPSTHTLTDESYVSIAEKNPHGEWEWPTTANSSQTILTGIAPSTEGSGEHITTVPIFEYYKYEGGNLSTTPISESELSSGSANETAAIAVRFTAWPSSERTTGARTVDLADTAVLRFDPASATGTNMPCS